MILRTLLFLSLLPLLSCGAGNRPAHAAAGYSAGAAGTASLADAAAVDAAAASLPSVSGDVAAGSSSTGPAPAQPEELPLPQMPAALREPRDRAAWLIGHFWEALDFRDTLRSRDRDFMEQNFANFVSLFPHAPAEAHAPAVHTLMQAAEADTAAYVLLSEIAEKYLYEPNSPMLCEEYFILFLEEIVRTPVLDDLARVRPRYLLEAARKNRPGMVAADFGYIARDGRRLRLSTTPGERLLLLFYDPDCDHCKEIIAALDGDAAFAEAVRTGRLAVLALYADGDRAAWERTKESLPAGWIVGFDTGEIRDGDLYVMPAMPTLYLLDGDRRVLLKDAPADYILALVAAGAE